MAERGTYEEQFGAVMRRVRRVTRAIRWHVKKVFGIQRSILVEIRWRLGDEIMALPIYGALQRNETDAAITVWCTYPELLSGNENVGAVNEDADPDRYILLRHAARDVSRIEHYARLAGVPVPGDRPYVAAPEVKPGDWTAPPGRRVAIAPGATWPTKQWSKENWKDVCEQLAQAGFDVAVLGNAGEGVGAGRDLTGHTTVMDGARMLAGADVCASSDSGLMHLALAVGTPVVALFGPTNPAILVRDDARLHAITNARECRFCWNDSQEMTEPGVCPRQIPACLGTINVNTVINEIRKVLENVP